MLAPFWTRIPKQPACQSPSHLLLVASSSVCMHIMFHLPFSQQAVLRIAAHIHEPAPTFKHSAQTQCSISYYYRLLQVTMNCTAARAHGICGAGSPAGAASLLPARPVRCKAWFRGACLAGGTIGGVHARARTTRPEDTGMGNLSNLGNDSRHVHQRGLMHALTGRLA